MDTIATIVKRCSHAEPKSCQDPWVVRWWVPDLAHPGKGKQKEKSFKIPVWNGKTYTTVYKAAEAFGKEVEHTKLTAPAEPQGGAVSFAVYAEKWLAAEPGSVSTVRVYTSVMKLHLLPVLGDRTLAEVANDRAGVKALLASLSPSAAKSAYTALLALLREAQEEGSVDKHQLARIKLTVPHKTVQGNGEFTFPTFAELTALTDELPEDLRPIVALMRGCGLRAGEALAVRAESFKDGHLRVTEQRQGSPDRLCGLKSKDPGYFRDVPVPGYVADIIGELPMKSGYLFPGWTNTRLNTAWRAAARRAGVPWVHPHLLRHQFASTALSRNVPIPDVAAWMGDTIQVVCRTYAHVIPKGWDIAKAVFDSEYAEWSA